MEASGIREQSCKKINMSRGGRQQMDRSRWEPRAAEMKDWLGVVRL